MRGSDLPRPAPAVARAEDSTVFVALELSRKCWLVASSAPGESKISKRTVTAGDGSGLLALLVELRERTEKRIGRQVRIVTIQEAGLDGFWLHRLLEANGLESQVVDPASIAVDRRMRRRKTDAIDVEALLRTLMAWARGERRENGVEVNLVHSAPVVIEQKGGWPVAASPDLRPPESRALGAKRGRSDYLLWQNYPDQPGRGIALSKLNPANDFRSIL